MSIFLFLTAATTEAPAEQASFNEYAVKAAFLFNFAKFIEWPVHSFENAQSPLSFCIIGSDPFKKNLTLLSDLTVKGRKIIIKKLAGEDDAGQCNAVFVSKSELDRVPQILHALQNANILTVGETRDFCKAGGVINLFIEQNMVRFEINVKAADRAGLTISSELLGLARIVREDGP